MVIELKLIQISPLLQSVASIGNYGRERISVERENFAAVIPMNYYISGSINMGVACSDVCHTFNIMI